MLRDEREIALNDILIACRRSADHFLQARELGVNKKLTELFDSMANRRNLDAGKLSGIVRGFGYLPDEPDSDRQDFSHLITLTRSAVTSDRGRMLLEKAVELEVELDQKIDGALVFDWGGNTPSLLRDIRASSRRCCEEMAEIMTRRRAG
ncbi:MAG: hypothetical protein WAM73_02785 [Desulfobacterales bacterium]